MAKRTREYKGSRKGWVIVTNNYTPEDEDAFYDEETFEYSIFGREKAPTTGTPHLQGYVHMRNKCKFGTVQKLFPHSWIVPAQGTAEENKVYSSKDGDFVEHGLCPVSGGRATADIWQEAKDYAKLGRLDDINPRIYICHYNTVQQIARDNATTPPDIDVLINEWHYGPTGCGKSRYVRQHHPGCYLKDTTRWWDKYNGQDVVLIEDVDETHAGLGRYFKLWADHYAFTAEQKHKCHLEIRPKKIIVTSNYAPAEIWTDPRMYLPIERRFKLIQHVK